MGSPAVTRPIFEYRAQISQGHVRYFRTAQVFQADLPLKVGFKVLRGL